MDEFARFNRLVLMAQEAALEPDRWNNVVSAIVEEVGASEGILFSPFLPPSLGGFWASRSIQPGHMEDYAAYYYDKDIWILAMRPEQMTTPGFVFRDEALISKQAVRSSEFYNDFLRQLDIGRLLCGVVLPHGSTTGPGSLHLSVFKPMSKTAFDENNQKLFQRLMPHLQAAIKTHYMLGTYNKQAALSFSALNSIPTAVLILNPEAHILFANDTAQNLLSSSDGFLTHNGSLIGSTSRQTKAIRSFTAKLFDANDSNSHRFPLRIERPSGRRSYTCFGQMLPISSAISGVNCPQAAILFIRDPEANSSIFADGLMEFHGLTPAEAQLAILLINGLNLDKAAAKRGISYETARSQLKSMFRKTNCNRQAELVKLLIEEHRI